jgi:hypothetical protein
MEFFLGLWFLLLIFYIGLLAFLFFELLPEITATKEYAKISVEIQVEILKALQSKSTIIKTKLE